MRRRIETVHISLLAGAAVQIQDLERESGWLKQNLEESGQSDVLDFAVAGLDGGPAVLL